MLRRETYFTDSPSRSVGWRPADGDELLYWVSRGDQAAMGILLEILTLATTNAEAAELLGCSESHVARLQNPAHPVGKVMAARLDAWRHEAAKKKRKALKRAEERGFKEVGPGLSLMQLPNGMMVARPFGSRAYRGDNCWLPSKLRQRKRQGARRG